MDSYYGNFRSQTGRIRTQGGNLGGTDLTGQRDLSAQAGINDRKCEILSRMEEEGLPTENSRSSRNVRHPLQAAARASALSTRRGPGRLK